MRKISTTSPTLPAAHFLVRASVSRAFIYYVIFSVSVLISVDVEIEAVCLLGLI